MRHTFEGYYVVDRAGRTQRDTIILSRTGDGRWYDAEGHDVVFQENEDLPAEEWLREPEGPWDRGLKEDIRGVAVVPDGDRAIFVLDPGEIDWLRTYDPDAIEWLPAPDGLREVVSA